MKQLTKENLYTIAPLLKLYNDEELGGQFDIPEVLRQVSNTINDVSKGVVFVDDLESPSGILHLYKTNELYKVNSVMFVGLIYVHPDKRDGVLSKKMIDHAKMYGVSIGCEKVWCAARGESMARRLKDLGGSYLEHIFEFAL